VYFRGEIDVMIVDVKARKNVSLGKLGPKLCGGIKRMPRKK